MLTDERAFPLNFFCPTIAVKVRPCKPSTRPGSKVFNLAYTKAGKSEDTACCAPAARVDTKEVFPEPETPATPTSACLGMQTVTSRRLCVLAPWIWIEPTELRETISFLRLRMARNPLLLEGRRQLFRQASKYLQLILRHRPNRRFVQGGVLKRNILEQASAAFSYGRAQLSAV